MRSAHLTLALFCQFLLASVVFYFTSLSAASPLLSGGGGGGGAPQQPVPSAAGVAAAPPKQTSQPQSVVAAARPPVEAAKSPAVVAATDSKQEVQPKSAASSQQSSKSAPAKVSEASLEARKYDSPPQEATSSAAAAEADGKSQAKPPTKQEAADSEHAAKGDSVLTKKDSDTVQPSSTAEQKKAARKEAEPAQSAPTSPLDSQQQPAKAQLVVEPVQVKQQKEQPKDQMAPTVPQPAALVGGPVEGPKTARAPEPAQARAPAQAPAEAGSSIAAAPVPSEQVPVAVAPKEPTVQKAEETRQAAPAPSPVAPTGQDGVKSRSSAATSPARSSPVVMGGLGPLHLLATTLCSYQPDKTVADENLSQLYARRASVRKSLFDFMSLKFTNLEKLSSRLGYGLQVVPSAVVANSQLEAVDSKPGLVPSHGWPVVGKCTAYDLKLMGEAAWCEQPDAVQPAASSPEQRQQQAEAAKAPAASGPSQAGAADDRPAPMTSNQHAATGRLLAGRSIDSGASHSLLPSPEESSVISKILHVGDAKSAPLAESSIYNLNLTQHQLATLEAHATSTQECRRNALRYSKALFNHLAEDQRQVSESWPMLYAAISADDCARKRLIDVFTALSSFRTDTTSIRRDNLEFAFAMDDLRAKVLENEVNTPLTFDRHFIEVEQFLQQSVRLMLANIQPKRAKLTSMRYRSLMYGASEASDEQCLDLHQRLLARNYPSDCNPTQFGQLPDVLRMTASSLELWSIEKELSMRTAKVVDYPNESPAGQQKVKDDVNECIANLVSS